MTAVWRSTPCRCPPHAALQELAAASNVSLNTLCTRALAEFFRKASPKPAAQTVEEPLVGSVRKMLGASLVGVILFGSTARGEEHDGSDVDLLIVVAPELPLSRQLYRQWDEAWPTGACSPHFVHLPGGIERAGSLWLEAAVDGIVLHDGSGSVQRFLGRLRRVIAEGRVVRRMAYGHPYWVKGDQGALRVQCAGARLQALAVLHAAGSWADVVREAQEAVEITLKALLRACRIEVPRKPKTSPPRSSTPRRMPPRLWPRRQGCTKR